MEGLGARVDALVAPQVGQVPAGVAAGGALVGFLTCVHAEVAFEVVEVGGGVGAVRAVVRFLLRVAKGVAGQVVGVVGQEGAMRALEQVGAPLSSPRSGGSSEAAGRTGFVFAQV